MPKRLEPLRHQPCKDCGTAFPVYHRFQERCEQCQKTYRRFRKKTYNKACKACGAMFKARNNKTLECPTCAKTGECRACGNKFEKTSYQNTYFCSERCRNVYKAELYFGGNYLSTLERDNYCCQKCGNMGPRLQVHHIDLSGRFKKKKNGKCNNDCDNLISLCNSCHQSLHTKITYQITQRHLDEVHKITQDFIGGNI